MIAFREHRGGLADSLKTIKLFPCESDALIYLETLGVTTIVPYGVDQRDDRIGWTKLRIVSDRHGVIGFLGEVE